MYTKHSLDRKQQRCIPNAVICYLQDYGAEKHDNRGCIIRHFNKKSINAMCKDLGSAFVKHISIYFNAYLVETVDGDILTVGWRQKPIREK